MEKKRHTTASGEDYLEAVSYTHLDVYKRQHHFSERPHDGDHAFPFGNIDANAVHPYSSNTKNLQPDRADEGTEKFL